MPTLFALFCGRWAVWGLDRGAERQRGGDGEVAGKGDGNMGSSWNTPECQPKAMVTPAYREVLFAVSLAGAFTLLGIGTLIVTVGIALSLAMPTCELPLWRFFGI
jgi:hypothetical protein